MQRIENNFGAPRPIRSRFGRALGAAIALAGCSPAIESTPPAVVAQEDPVLLCGQRGHLQTELYGAIAARLEWNREQLECSGMRRPDGKGARLRFAGSVAGGIKRIALIIAMPELQRDAIGDEFASNVTVIEEGSGRFFSTRTHDNCLTDVTALDALDASGDRFAIDGILYCVSPIPEVNGTSSLFLREMRFSGLIDWSTS